MLILLYNGMTGCLVSIARRGCAKSAPRSGGFAGRMTWWMAFLALLILTVPVAARDWQLVCFERLGIEQSLGKVSNPQQFLRNDRILRSGSCDFARIPANSTARFSSFHTTGSGFIFPVFQVRYGNTGQRMYAADGIFRRQTWRVSTRLQDCRHAKFTDVCLVPADCDVLNGYLDQGQPAAYLAIPSSCQTFRID